ncbi:MAG: hypothetical protein ACP5KV_08220, partial [Candidatus Methanomethylicaceae archaeon]
MVDLTTLDNTMRKYEAIGIKNILFILDRGYFTKSNLKMLIDSNYEFIIGASHTFKEIKHLTLKAKKDIENANNLLRIEDKIIFYRDARMVLDGKELSLYVYYDIEREKYEKERFYLELES